MKQIDYKKLKGEDLFLYFVNDNPDKDYASVVALLPYAVIDENKAYEILDRVVKEDKKLVVVYPGMDEKPEPDWEFIGSVMDGELYVS